MKKIKISILTSLYKSHSYLELFLKNFLDISNINEVELVIIHNNPSSEEKEILHKYSDQIPHLVYKEVQLEGLYSSWNRAIKLSNGHYLAMWSVDDRRVTDSLEKQAEVLDKEKDCVIVTGNYYKVFNYGDTSGYLKKDPAKRNLFNKVPKFNNGCFLMWRKSIHEHVGYFDEQFKISGDWEFWCRVTKQYKARSINSVLGYYLRKSNEGLSKAINRKQDIENQIVKLRHYNFYLINPYPLFSNKKFHISAILNFDKIRKIKVNFFKIGVKIIPSLLLFWMPSFKRSLVNFKYTKLENA